MKATIKYYKNDLVISHRLCFGKSMKQIVSVAFIDCPYIDYLVIEIIPQSKDTKRFISESGKYHFKYHDKLWIKESEVEDGFWDQFKI